MTTDERNKQQYRKANQVYLRLTAEQCDMHMEIMGKAMSLWPESLQAHCKDRASVEDFSGDALACWVADWLKSGNTLEDPLAKETDEEFDAGCDEALKLLGVEVVKQEPGGMDLTEFVKSGEFPDISVPFPKAIKDELKKRFEESKNNKNK